MISTVLLDVDNTLLDFNACALASMQDAFHTFDLPFSKEVVFPTFLRINDQLWAQIEEGNLTKGEHYRIRWNLILKELDIDFNGIRLEDQFVEGLHHYAVPIQGALEELLRQIASTLELSLEEAHYFLSTPDIESNMYNPADDSIEILYGDGSTRSIAEASDMFDIALLARKVKKHFLCYWRL